MDIIEKIKVLDISIANKIAAGEVVERPASVVKELIENSIDAGANVITVEITDGGISYIRVSDNGCGMNRHDAKNCFLRHATSKLQDVSDLFSIKTLGFRGEAMASIAAVARVTLKTRPKADEIGTLVLIDGGKVRDVSPCGCPDGTVIEVTDLFYNVPARAKFLKSAKTEASYISDYVLRMTLARPDISFKYINNGNVIYHSLGDGDLKNAIYSIYGGDYIPHIKPVSYQDSYVTIKGYIGDEHITRPTKAQQSIFINGRYVKCPLLAMAILESYDTRIMVGRYPFVVLSFQVAYEDVDVNVHPNKLEVKFSNEDKIRLATSEATKAALGAVAVPIYNISDTKTPEVEAITAPSVEDKQRLYNELMSKTSFTQSGDEAEPVTPETPVQPMDTEAPSPQEQKSTVSFSEPPKPTKTEVPLYTPEPVTEPMQESVQVEFDCSPYQIIGCAFDSFWIISQGENLILLDQHAAHERILYEKAMAGTLKAESQILLIPILVKLTAEEYNVFSDNQELFEEFGFEIEQFGTLTLRITAVPSILSKVEDEGFLKDAIAMLSKQKNVTLKDLKRETLIRASCKGAIKLGNTVPPQMISDLLDEFNATGTALTCPHGRPVMVAITKNELFKRFKRIV